MATEDTRLVRYPSFDVKFLTEQSEYNIRYDSNVQTDPSDQRMSNSVISMTTKNAMADDSAVFSFVLAGDVYWDKVLTPNDVVILKVQPNYKKTALQRADINDVVLVGLVNEVRVEGDYAGDSKMYRISGQSFAKVLIDFELGVIQQVSVVLSEVGWLPDDTGADSMTFTNKSASEIADTMMDRFLGYTKYKFTGNKTVRSFLTFDNLDSWTEYENLTDASQFINYEGSLKQLLDDITEKPFNELYFDFSKDETCDMIMRRTPFDESDWNRLPVHEIDSRAVISESVARSDTEAYSIFNVIVDNPLGAESVDFGSFPRYNQELVDKYGYSKLELNNKYLMQVLDSTDSGDAVDTSEAPEGEEMEVEATAYSYKQEGLSDTTYDGTKLTERPKVIAVDPSVIPLGSTVWVEGLGNYHAGDTGGDIKGKRIDIHMTSVEDCKAFGRKKVKIVIVKRGSNSNQRVARDSNSTKLDSIYRVAMSYLTAYEPKELRVRKAVVSTKLKGIDTRITENKAQILINTFLINNALTLEQFSMLTGLTASNVEEVGDRVMTYSKLKKFLKDYSDKTIEDKSLVRDAIVQEFKDVNRDDALNIATTFLNNKGKISKKEYETVFKKGTEGQPEPQEVSSENLKTFTMKIANWYGENSNFYAGEIKVVGSPVYRIGNRLRYLDEQNSELWEYYIEGVQHEYSYTSGFVTTLSVTRGLQQGGLKRFTNLWGKSEEFKGGLLGEKSLADLYSEGLASSESSGGGSSSTDGNYGVASSKEVEKAVTWFRDRKGKVTYSMGDRGPRTGPNSYDCSGAVYTALIEAGILPSSTWKGNTESLYALEGKILEPIQRKQVKRGDLFVAGVKGASVGGDGHTGMFLDGNNIIHCNSPDNGISETPATGYMGDPRLPVYFYRIKGAKK